VIYVAFVRAVMIGREGLDRHVLLDMFDLAGATRSTSYISTGNVSFEAPPERVAAIVEQVESDLEHLLGRPTELFVRTLSELGHMRASEPFTPPPFDEPRDRVVTFFRDAVPEQQELPIVSQRGDFSVFLASGREVFSVTREIAGRTQAPGGVIERLAGERVTTRAWSTIERIVDKLSST
jgi:uncharacterized protein (DUF1697 family)